MKKTTKKLLILITMLFTSLTFTQVITQDKLVKVRKDNIFKKVFKYSTIYGSYSQTNSIQASQTFIVTQQNNLIETTRKHPSDMMVTYGLRKLAFFQYENRNKFYDGTEKNQLLSQT